MGLSLPSARQGRKHNRFLSLAAKAAKRFLGKPLNGLEEWEKPKVINTDKAPTYGLAISELKTEGKWPQSTVHPQVKYLNNVVEADHGKLKQLIRPVRVSKAENSLRDHHGI